ncbi:MAG: DsrE/DsrF/DrsH-like family protein, partial [Gammaproteobacteria bacterium]|nr:DsrE/DsrF/DrsH-like family protein [Gammaproteobacteria bacterium]
MERTIKEKGVASIQELRALSIEAEVKIIGCEMTADLFGYDKAEFIDEVSEWVGAASFLSAAKDANICLFV